MPHGRGAHGLPLAVQLVGAHEADMTLLGWTEWAANSVLSTK